MTQEKRLKSNLPSSRKALVLIAGLLFGSALLRIVVGATDAIALEATDEMPMPAVEPIDRNDDHTEMQNHACTDVEGLAVLLEEVNARATRLDDRESRFQDRMAGLKLAEQEIAKNLKALEAAEKKLSETLALADAAAENDLTRLTSVYESMKPKEAAELFAEMSPDFAAGFLARMRPEAAASIMAGLEPTTAYSISVVLAGRNANVPTE